MENLVLIENDFSVEAKEKIYNFLKQKEEIEKQEKQLREEILKFFKENKILKIENEKFSIIYKSESQRETFDSKKFKNEHEDLYNEYVKFSNVKPSLLIRVK